MKKKIENKHAGIKALGIVAITIGLSLLYLWHFESVSVISLFKNPDEVFWSLPLEIIIPSRIYDFIAAVIFLVIITKLLKYKDRPKYRTEELFFGSLMGAIFGIIIVVFFMCFGLAGIKAVLCFEMGVLGIGGIIFGAIISRKAALILNYSFAIFTSLSLGLGVIIKVGITLGLMAGIIIFVQMFMLGSVAIIIGNFLFKKTLDRFTSST